MSQNRQADNFKLFIEAMYEEDCMKDPVFSVSIRTDSKIVESKYIYMSDKRMRKTLLRRHKSFS